MSLHRTLNIMCVPQLYGEIERIKNSNIENRNFKVASINLGKTSNGYA